MVYPDGGYGNPASWPRCAPLTPHFLAICATEIDDAAAAMQCAELLNRAGGYSMAALPTRANIEASVEEVAGVLSWVS